MEKRCYKPFEHSAALTLTAFQKWMISVLLIIPATLPYIAHFLIYKYGKVPTGFIQPDMPQYMAYARELFENGTFHVFYGNPFDPNIDTPHIYFQVQTFILGVIWYLTLVLSESESTGYLTTVYTSFRSWQSHSFTTPGYYNRKIELENLFKKGLFIDEWENRSLLIIMYRNISADEKPIWMIERNCVLVFQNAYYIAFRITPDK